MLLPLTAARNTVVPTDLYSSITYKEIWTMKGYVATLSQSKIFSPFISKGLTYLFKNLASDRVNKTHARTVNDHVMHISEVFIAGFYTSITWPNTAPVALEIRCATSLTHVSRRTVTNRHWYTYVITSASGGSHGRLGVNMAVGPTEQSVLALK